MGKTPDTRLERKPCCYLLAEEDRMINPVAWRNAWVRASGREKVDHRAPVSAPEPVTEVTLEAVAASAA